MIVNSCCDVCGKDTPINDNLCAECRLKIENFDEAIFLLKECEDLIMKALPDSSVWTDYLSDRLDELFSKL